MILMMNKNKRHSITQYYISRPWLAHSVRAVAISDGMTEPFIVQNLHGHPHYGVHICQVSLKAIHDKRRARDFVT